jgi:hypothetical protein
MSRHFSHAAALPRSWTRHVRSGLLQAVPLAAAWTLTCSRAATSRSQRRCLEAELDRAHTEIALLKEELQIKDERWSRLPSRRRPHYTAIERLRILELKAARGWSREQAARIFLLYEQTEQSSGEQVPEWFGRDASAAVDHLSVLYVHRVRTREVAVGPEAGELARRGVPHDHVVVPRGYLDRPALDPDRRLGLEAGCRPTTERFPVDSKHEIA